MNRLAALVLAAALVGTTLPGPAGVAAAQAETTLLHDGDAVTVEAGPGQAVRGQTDLPAGTTVTLRLRSTGANPFLLPAEAVVDSEGRFRAVLDLSSMSAGTSFEVVVRHDGTTLATADGEVVECAEACDGGTAADATTFATGEDGTLSLEAGPGRAVAGTAALPAGTTVSVRLRSTGASPFLLTTEAVVDGEGRFRAVLDLSDVQPGMSFDAVIHRDGEELATANGTVTECTSDCTPPPGEETPAGETTTPSGDELAVQSVVSVDRGDSARIAVGLGDAEAATLSVGGPSVNFVSNVTVRDGDGDGIVTVLFDTAAAGQAGQTAVAADGDDSARVPDGAETRLDSDQWALAAGEYPMALHRGQDATGEEADVGTLVVREVPESERETGDATTTPWRGEEFGLRQSVVTARQGEVARIGVGLGDAEAATLEFGGPETGWRANVTVRDGDDADSAVVLLFDTTAAGRDAPAFSVAAEGDGLSIEDGTGVEVADGNASIATGDYPISVYRGASTDEEADIGTLVVERGIATGTVADPGGTDAADDPGLLGGLGLLGAGGVLAVVGLALLLGLFRR